MSTMTGRPAPSAPESCGGDAADVPLAALVDHLDVARLDVHPGEIHRVRALVGDEIQRLAVGAPLRAPVADALLVGRQVATLARREVEHGQIDVETGVGLCQHERVVVGAPAADAEPAVTLVD